MRVFLMGGTGLVGGRLIPKLKELGHEVVLLTRRPEQAKDTFGSQCEVVSGNPKEAGAWMEAVDGCDAVINLTGEGVFNKRWTAAFKQELYDSRIISTRHAVQALERKPQSDAGTPKILVNASAIGYYGAHGDEILDESSPPGDDFLAKLCIDWEKAALAAQEKGIRVAIVRVGVVLDKGGALQKMILPFKMFVGGPVGSGKQYVSWIHYADLVSIFLLSLENNDATGPLNGTAPNPITNKELSTAIGKTLCRPSFLPAPSFGLRLALGQVAEVVTTGQRVLPKRAQELAYPFQFTDIETALKDILG